MHRNSAYTFPSRRRRDEEMQLYQFASTVSYYCLMAAAIIAVYAIPYHIVVPCIFHTQFSGIYRALFKYLDIACYTTAYVSPAKVSIATWLLYHVTKPCKSIICGTVKDMLVVNEDITQECLATVNLMKLGKLLSVKIGNYIFRLNCIFELHLSLLHLTILRAPRLSCIETHTALCQIREIIKISYCWSMKVIFVHQFPPAPLNIVFISLIAFVKSKTRSTMKPVTFFLPI
jgi:hypothetical protein